MASSKHIIIIIIIITGVIAIIYLPHLHKWIQEKKNQRQKVSLAYSKELPIITLEKNSPFYSTNHGCHYYNCFNVFKCGFHEKHILISIASPIEFKINSQIVAQTSKEFLEILKSIESSPFYTPIIEKACIVILPLDLLNEDKLLSSTDAGKALYSHPSFKDGENILLFTMLPGIRPHFPPRLTVPTGKAMIAASGFSSHYYRSGYDLSFPTLPIISNYENLSKKSNNVILSFQLDLKTSVKNTLRALALKYKELKVLESCKHNITLSCDDNGTVHNIAKHLRKASFCLLLPGIRLATPALLESMSHTCIPVILMNSVVLPFSEVLDRKSFSVILYEHHLSNVVQILRQISDTRKIEYQKQLIYVYQQYFKNISVITNTLLNILNDRIFPQYSRSFYDWNLRSEKSLHPLFFQSLPPSYIGAGFTAVVLTYDRIDSLIEVINCLSKVPSLSMILVVWNNQEKKPPGPSKWPKISKPIKILQTKANYLSNRFFPYEEIQTECVLSLDDDITMLTSDELEFGYQTWREFPDRLVGFPSRSHVWKNNKWKYESEWTSEISMVLTRAAFYHKIWNYEFSFSESQKVIRNWVDKNFNCEDIAINFMVANITNKGPIKVTPRKKIKCSLPNKPNCLNENSIFEVDNHINERSACINKLVEIYGWMPLRRVEFRADPVLYKDPVNDEFKMFNNIGNL